uniref:DUF4445 domain-containing protein n=2 Tax=Thermofilum pendens TaxID=2269 RepID=A0A7J3X9G4_THEPE
MAAEERVECVVRFLPHNVVSKVVKGATILEAAIKCGVGIRSVCGGKGLCGKCKVIVRKGGVDVRRSDLLKREEVERGYVLACQARILEDVEVEIPLESQMGRPRLQSSVALPSIKPKPVIRQENLPLSSLPSVLPMYTPGAGVLEKLSEIGSKGTPRIYAVLSEARRRIIDVGEGERGLYGLAVDIGTTKIAAALVDIGGGRVLGTASEFNKQLIYGEDIVSRIRIALDSCDGLKKMQKAAVETVNAAIDALCKRHRVPREDIFMVTAAGNTAMTYLFVGLDPYPLIKSFKERAEVPRTPYWLEARDLGLSVSRNADVYVLPCAGRFLGGDVIGDIITAGLNFSEEPALLVDIGTNTEVVIGCKDWFLGTTAPAGPAFEGWGLTHGVRAVAGAIESVTIDAKTCKAIYRTIDNAKPIGICGSGYIDLLAQLFVNGLVDAFGKFYRDCDCPYVRKGEKGYEYVVAPAEETATGRDIVVTEEDLYNIIDSKSSVCSAVSILLKKMLLTVHDISKVYVCGAFGNYLNLNSAMTIGMIPEFIGAKVEYIGNGSLGGAILTLLSEDYRAEAERVAKLLAPIELLLDPDFMEEYQAGFILPGKKELFPTWRDASRNIKPWKP